MARYQAKDFGTQERARADRIQAEYLKCIEKLAMIEYRKEMSKSVTKQSSKIGLVAKTEAATAHSKEDIPRMEDFYTSAARNYYAFGVTSSDEDLGFSHWDMVMRK